MWIYNEFNFPRIYISHLLYVCNIIRQQLQPKYRAYRIYRVYYHWWIEPLMTRETRQEFKAAHIYSNVEPRDQISQVEQSWRYQATVKTLKSECPFASNPFGSIKKQSILSFCVFTGRKGDSLCWCLQQVSCDAQHENKSMCLLSGWPPSAAKNSAPTAQSRELQLCVPERSICHRNILGVLFM